MLLLAVARGVLRAEVGHNVVGPSDRRNVWLGEDWRVL
jgi:hypothetical protein